MILVAKNSIEQNQDLQRENRGYIIGAIILGIMAIACFVISYLQFNERGFLFNNAYIFASKQERETIEKSKFQFGELIFLMKIKKTGDLILGFFLAGSSIV